VPLRYPLRRSPRRTLGNGGAHGDRFTRGSSAAILADPPEGNSRSLVTSLALLFVALRALVPVGFDPAPGSFISPRRAHLPSPSDPAALADIRLRSLRTAVSIALSPGLSWAVRGPAARTPRHFASPRPGRHNERLMNSLEAESTPNDTMDSDAVQSAGLLTYLLVELDRRRAELETLNRELSAAREQLRAEHESALAAAEARREKEEIRRLESEHAQLLDISSDAIFVWELDGVIQYWNKGAAELYGFESDEAVGRSSHELLSTAHADGLHNVIEELRRTRLWRGELTHRTKGGGVLTVQSSMQMVVRGNQILVMESNRDLTERKRSEDLLREADRRKDEFLAVLSHELRNPLAPIRNVAEYLNLIKVPEQKLDWARRVLYRQVTHMSRILDDLLDVSRISRGRLILKKSAVSANEIVDAAIETVRPLIDEKAHRLVIELPSDLPMLDGDPVRLTQVISNLLTNAVKYTDRGGLIELRGSVEHRTLCLCVKDNGIGIPPEQIPRLFTMFEQVAGTRDRSEGGLGIGLALAKGIIELHGGTIAAKSPADGPGSEFLIHLPALDTRPASVAAPEAMPQSDLAKLRILIADDNRDAADSLALLLRLQHQEVRVAHDGRSALSIAHRFRPNIVLLDIGMPESDGYEVARALRQQPWAAGLCLIALTGRGRREDERQALEAGFDFHLRKPYELRDLEAVIAAQRWR
jgi:PAS domain S-box-containing protein